MLVNGGWTTSNDRNGESHHDRTTHDHARLDALVYNSTPDDGTLLPHMAERIHSILIVIKRDRSTDCTLSGLESFPPAALRRQQGRNSTRVEENKVVRWINETRGARGVRVQTGCVGE